MATYTTTLAASNSSDADFRAWGKWISDRLTDMGITKTADTGQIDWSTVTAPAAVNTSQGYEIRQLQDALSGTDPVLIKIEYGSGAQIGRPSIWLTIGVSSDGAGTLTGGITHQQQILSVATDATLRTCIASGDSGRCSFGMFLSTSYTLWFSIERTPDANGDPTNEGILWAGGSTSAFGSVFQQGYQLNVANTTTETSIGSLFPVIGHGSDGTNTALYPVKMTKGPFYNECLGLMCAFNANVTAGTTITFPFYGADHTYYPMGTNFTLATASIRGSLANTAGVMLRYE